MCSKLGDEAIVSEDTGLWESVHAFTDFDDDEAVDIPAAAL
jgi:hypothetical protein